MHSVFGLLCRFLNRTAVMTLLFLLLELNSFAQHINFASGSIKGRIIDSLTSQPVEFAAVSLFTEKDNKVVNGLTAHEKGIFKLDNISEGNYKLIIEFIGYRRKEKHNIVISRQKSNIDLGDLKMGVTQLRLKEVNITGEKATVEYKIDKMIYNVEKDVTSQSGVATDVLKKVPQVSVDVDGNVDLQGNTDIRFLIDGKPSVLFGSNITDVLQAIPASQIQSIEVITSPGAKYDAEGTGGIINIILKKSKAHGVNFSTSLSGGTRLENGSMNLNVRNGNFGVNAWVSGNGQLPSTTVNKLDRTTYNQSSVFDLLQDGSSKFSRLGYQSGIGFDWDVRPKDNISGTFGYNYYGNSSIGSVNRQSLMQDDEGNQLSDISDMLNTTNKYHQHSYNWDVRYKKKFNRKDQELLFSVNSSNSNLYSYYDQEQLKLLNDSIEGGSYGNNPGKQSETNIELNYTQPLSENATLETGGKAVLDHISNNSDVYELTSSPGIYDYNSSQSSSVDYFRGVYAAYITFTCRLFKLIDIKPGLRDEYTLTSADYSNAGTVSINPYNTVVPSMVVSHNFKNNQNLKISYSHRIQRPGYNDLNPFVNESDPYNVTTGNPNLHPETGDKVELSYSETSKKGISMNSTLFYRGNRNDIQSYTTYYPTYKIGDSIYNNVAVTTRENIGKEDNYGMNFYISVPIKEKLNLRSNISGFERYIFTGLPTGGNIHGFNYRLNLNVSYQLTSTLVLEMFGNFNSLRINAQGTLPSFTTYNFAFRKQFLNKKASVALTATNFFDNYVNQKTELTGENFTISNLRQIPFRSFGFNITYRIGKMEFRKEKENDDMNMNPPEN